MKILLLALLLSPLAHASEGFTVRGGGDEIALEFTDALSAALAEIHKNQLPLEAQIASFSLATLPAQTKIYVVDEALLVHAGSGEQESVAANEPSSLTIWIERARWQAVTNPRIREAIALHEFLSLAKAESTGSYPISSAYLGKFQEKSGPDVIVTGQDKQDPNAWKKRQVSCEYKSVAKSKTTSEEVVETNNYTSAVVGWRFAGREYEMRFHLTSSVDFGKNPQFWPQNQLLSQSTKSIEWSDERGMLYMLDEKNIEADPFVFGVVSSGEDSPQLRFEESEGNVRTIWTWDRNRKRDMVSRFTTTRLPDGSTRTVEETGLDSNEKFEQTSSTTTCDERQMPDDSWISLQASQEIEQDVTKLNELAAKANAAESAYWGCKNDNCPKARDAADSTLDAFDDVWNKIFNDTLKRAQKDPKYAPSYGKKKK